MGHPHHHHGGGRIPPFVYGGPWYGNDPGVQLFTIDDSGPCPNTQAPVVANDGLVYQNACKARMAGAKPVKNAMTTVAGAMGSLGADPDPNRYQLDIATTSPYVKAAMIGPDGASTDITQPARMAFGAGAAAGVAVIGMGFLAASLLRSIFR